MSGGAASGDVLAFRAKRRGLPIPESACRVLGDFGHGIPDTRRDVTFHLRRSKRGVDMKLAVVGRSIAFTWSLSLLENVWPATYADARAWLATYAARHGQVFTEVDPRRPPAKRATGDDAKLLKSGGCREAWLRSDVPTLWAEAMVRCRSAAADCGAKGFCDFGDCDMEMDPPAPVDAEGVDMAAGDAP